MMITVKYLKDDDERYGSANDVQVSLERKVYFDLKFGASVQDAIDAKALGMYIPVLQIESDDLEYAFKIMQNGVVTDSWLLMPVSGTTPLVEPIKQGGRKLGWRSACVGDIFELNGVDYLCCNVGFAALNKQQSTYEITLQDDEETWHSWRQVCRDYQEAAESGIASAKLRNMRLHNIERIK
jgi:hypothetical protein